MVRLNAAFGHYFWLVLTTFVLELSTTILLVDAQPSWNDEEDNSNLEYESAAAKRQRHNQAKAWHLRKIELWNGKIKLPVSPVTLMVLFFSLYYLYTSLFGGSSSGSGSSRNKKKVYCEASHILIMDHSKATKEKLLDYQRTIQSNVELFAKHAQKYSACPSGKSTGGNLGKFGLGEMAPPFEKLCFDPNTPMQTTVGPVQTNFGWHLIYIHSRQLPAD
ncbi:hypothetical protein ACA910_001024 [Epithemia clementina (nom. ined.)]